MLHVIGLLRSQPKLWTSNIVGFVLSLYYFFSFARFAPSGISSLPGSVDQHIQGLIVIAAFTLGAAKLKHSEPIGNLGVFINLAMYASPLAAIKTVLTTKSSASIPLPLTVASLLSCIFWAVTGYFDMKDPNVYVSPTLGVLFGVMQVLLKLMYGENSHKNLSPDLNSVDVVLK